MPSTGVNNVIFDWSGTLSDDFKLSFVSTMATLKAFGGPRLTLQQYREQFTLPVRDFYGRHLKGASVEEIDRYYFDHFTPSMGKTGLYPDVKEILRACKRLKIRIFVFSTVRQSLLEAAAKRLGVASFFTAIKGSVMDKVPELKRFAREQGLKPAQTMYVGDMEHDIEAARAANMQAGVFLNGYHAPERLLKHAPDFVWNDQSGFLRSVKTWGARREVGKPVPLPTVGALVFNAGKILLIQTHKWDHTFGIPGGKIRYRETMVAALKREFREETGLALTDIRPVMVHDSIDSEEFYRKGSHFLLMNFYARSQTQNVRLNDEAESFIWIEPELALRFRLNEPTRVLIEHYLKHR